MKGIQRASRAKKMGLPVILARPAYKNPINPYNKLLYQAVEEIGKVEVVEHRYLSFPRRARIYHIHWPVVMPARYSPRSVIRVLVEWAWLCLAHFADVKVIWTAHNAFPHDLPESRVNSFLWNCFLRSVDGVIFLSEVTRRDFIARHPRLSSVPTAVVKHGHYGPWVRNVRDSGQAVNRDIDEVLRSFKDTFVIFAFGRLLPYKNTDGLMRAFTKLADPSLRLLVCGSASGPYLSLLQSLALDPRIVFIPSHIDDRSLISCLERADLTVLPYRKMLNSGAALMALTVGTHVLAPAIGSMPNLLRDVGDGALTLFDGSFTEDVLEGAIQRLRNGLTGMADLREFEWQVLAQETVNFYLEVLAR